MINLKDYQDTLKQMVPGQRSKVPHKGCSESRCLSILMDVKGYVAHCFKCGDTGFLPHEDQTFRDRKKREAEKAAYQRERQRAGFNLPADFGQTIDSAGLAWLGSGGWTSDMIQKYSVGWSGLLSRVVFQVQPKGWISRAVYPEQKPKYLSKTPSLAWWTSETITDRVCLTEDILSAGRVGQFYPAMAILGTDQFNHEIVSDCKQLLIWTDGDAAGEKARRRIHAVLQWLFWIEVIDIRTPKDPKCYTNRELQEILRKEVSHF